MPFCVCFAANVDPTEGADYAGHYFHSSNMHGNRFWLLEHRKCWCPLNLPSFKNIFPSFLKFLQSSHQLFTLHAHLHMFKDTSYQPQPQASPRVAAISASKASSDLPNILPCKAQTDGTLHITYYSSSNSLRHEYCACSYCNDAKVWLFCRFKFALLCILKTDTLLY